MGIILHSTYMGFYAMQDMLQYGIKGALSALTFGSFGMIIPSPWRYWFFSICHPAGDDVIRRNPRKRIVTRYADMVRTNRFRYCIWNNCFFLLPIVNKRRKISHEEYQIVLLKKYLHFLNCNIKLPMKDYSEKNIIH